MGSNQCVCCSLDIPEGTHVCKDCSSGIKRVDDKDVKEQKKKKHIEEMRQSFNSKKFHSR